VRRFHPTGARTKRAPTDCGEIGPRWSFDSAGLSRIVHVSARVRASARSNSASLSVAVAVARAYEREETPAEDERLAATHFRATLVSSGEVGIFRRAAKAEPPLPRLPRFPAASGIYFISADGATRRLLPRRRDNAIFGRQD